MVKTIMVFHIFVRSTKILKIHIDIRHADTVGVEEPLEQELVLDRIKIGNPQTVGNH